MQIPFSIAAIALVSAACTSVAPPAPEPESETWRQVYAVPGTSESQRELIVWDFTDAQRPVAHVFSFQDGTFRKWQEVLLPTEPGTIWAEK